MTLRPGEVPGRSIAVFPFLTTSESVRLGSFELRSTNDTVGLNEEDAAHVREVAEMLFLQDDLRIRSAVYAMLPALDLDKAEPCLRGLEQLQAIVAYCYSAPHPTSGDPFFHFEQTSLAILSPEPVLIFLVRSDHNVEPINPSTLIPDHRDCVGGYRGLYNFRQPFWVAKGSRLYPPVPHIGLNISQNLAHDLSEFFALPQHHLLPDLLRPPTTETRERVLTALAWYNRANAFTSDDDSAIMNLAVAFESLLALPKDAKTDRFVDAVSLLLGRVTRLDLWAEQFYAARSDVAHEGRTERLRFMPAKQKNCIDGPLYQALLTYGRQIFRLCVGSVLFGDHLGARAGLRDRLVTNQERFQYICKTLDDESMPVLARFAAIDQAVSLTSEFRFVQETGLRIDTMIGAVQRAAKNLLLCSDSLEHVFKQGIGQLAATPRSTDSYEALASLQALQNLKIMEPADSQSPQTIMRRLAEVVWHYTFMHYFWLKEQRERQQDQHAG